MFYMFFVSNAIVTTVSAGKQLVKYNNAPYLLHRICYILCNLFSIPDKEYRYYNFLQQPVFEGMNIPTC